MIRLSSNATWIGLSYVQIRTRRVLPPRGWHAMKLSRSLAMVGSEQSTELLNTDNLTLMTFIVRLNDLVKTLVNPLVMIVLEILGQHVAQLVFRGEDEMIEALFFDGPDESLRVGVQIRTSRRQFQGLHTGGFQVTVHGFWGSFGGFWSEICIMR